MTLLRAVAAPFGKKPARSEGDSDVPTASG